MKLVQGRNCLAVMQNDEILFVHSDIVPFLTLTSKEGKKDVLCPLPSCEVDLFEEKKASLIFSNGERRVKADLIEKNDVVNMTLDGASEKFFFFVHAKKGETILGKGINEENLKGKKYLSSSKTKIPAAWEVALFGNEKRKIKDLIPVYYGDGYGVKVDGKVEELDFTSDLSTKITCKNFKSLTIAISRNKDEIRNALQ